MSNKIKLAFYFCAKILGVFALARHLTASKIRILCYHGGSIGDEAHRRQRRQQRAPAPELERAGGPRQRRPVCFLGAIRGERRFRDRCRFPRASLPIHARISSATSLQSGSLCMMWLMPGKIFASTLMSRAARRTSPFR